MKNHSGISKTSLTLFSLTPSSSPRSPLSPTVSTFLDLTPICGVMIILLSLSSCKVDNVGDGDVDD